KKPAIAFPKSIGQQVQFMITHHTLCIAFIYQLFDPFNHRNTVLPPITQITNKNQFTLLRMTTVPVITQHMNQLFQSCNLAMNIPNDIHGASESLLYK